MELLLPPSIEEIEFELETTLCLQSFSHFVRRFWPIIEPGVPLIWGWHLDAICDHLQAIDDGLFNRLIICIPPGFAKSSLVSCLWPAWSWLRRPWLRSLFGSYDEKLTYRDSVKCKDIIKSDLYQVMFNPEWRLRGDVSSKGYFANDMQGARKTYYIGSSKKTGWRANYVIVDDPLSAEDRYDTRIKANVVESWDKVMSTRANISQHHAFVVIMQRLAIDDLCGYLISKYGDKYIQLILPQEFVPKTRCETPIFRDPRTEPGELLAPSFFPQLQVDIAKISLGEVDFAAQHNHSPYLLAGDRFKAEFFQFWNYSSISHELLELKYRSGNIEYIRIRDCQRFLSVDFAASEKAKSDFTVIGLWAVTRRNELLLLYASRIKEREFTIVETIKSIYYMGQFGPIPPTTVYAEQNGLGLPIAQHTQDAGLPVEFVVVSKDKLVSSASASVRIQGGQIFFPDYSVYPWMQEFSDELMAFPGGPHDDYVSMLSIASNSMFERRMGSIASVSTVIHDHPNINATKFQTDLHSNQMFNGVQTDERYVNGHSHTKPPDGWSKQNGLIYTPSSGLGYNSNGNGHNGRRHT